MWGQKYAGETRYLLDLLHVSSVYFVTAQWLKDPGPRSEKRTLLCDMACFLLITPLAAISGWLCLRGAQDHLQLKSRLEAVGLIALTIALFTIYILWTLVTEPPLLLQRRSEVLAASQCFFSRAPARYSWWRWRLTWLWKTNEIWDGWFITKNALVNLLFTLFCARVLQ